MPEYQHLTNEELLHLAEQRRELTEEAVLSLDAELSKRKISAADIQSYRAEFAAAKEADSLQIGTLGVVHTFGAGRKLFGKSNRIVDSLTGFETYDTTLWFLLFWFPIFPVATYTIRREIQPWWNIFSPDEFTVLQRHPRNWEQILLTWIKAVGVLIVLRLIMLWFVHRS